MELTAKQERFCQEYLIDFNATQAAVRAGYSEKTACEQASRLLANVKVQNRIQELTFDLQKKTEITKEKVIAEYAKIAFTDIRDYYDEGNLLLPIKDIPSDAAAALAGVEIELIYSAKIPIGETKKIKRWDKVKALDGLSKILGFNAPEKSEVKIDSAPLSDSQVDKILNEIKANKAK